MQHLQWVLKQFTKYNLGSIVGLKTCYGYLDLQKQICGKFAAMPHRFLAPKLISTFLINYDIPLHIDCSLHEAIDGRFVGVYKCGS